MRLLPVLLVAVLLLTSYAVEAGSNPGQYEVAAAAQYNYSSGQPTVQTERAVFLELFTAVWCTTCYEADAKLAELAQNTSRNSVIVVEQHGDPGADLGLNASADRMDQFYLDYSLFGFPHAVIDGVDWVRGFSHVDEKYDGSISNRSGVEADFQLTLGGSIDSEASSYDLEVQRINGDPFHQQVFLMLVEDPLTYDYNGDLQHRRQVVRALLDLGPLDGEDSISFTGSIPLEGDWNISRLGLVAIIQNNGDTTLPPEEESEDVPFPALGFLLIALISLAFVAHRRRNR